MVYKSFDQILESLKSSKKKSRVAVVGAANKSVLDSVFQAEKMGIVKPVLIGDEKLVKELIKEFDKNPDEYQIYNCQTGQEAGVIGVELVKTGHADFIMKGMAETKEVLKPVVDKSNNLNTGRTISHMAINQIPSFSRLTVVTDGGMIPHPSLSEKKDIIKNAVDTLIKIGYEKPRVAIACGVEKVNPKMPETIEAQQLSQMAIDGEIENCHIVGPISYDLIVDSNAAKIKGFPCDFCGEFDIILAPNLAAGNILNKSLTITGGGKMAGIIVGAKVPIIITSRGSSSEEKLLSLAFASLVSKQEVL